MHDGEGRDDFLIQQAGRLRHVGCDEEIILAHLERINGDPTVIADPKSEDDLKRIARSAARYDVPPPDPQIIFGKTREQPEAADLPERVRPEYPIFSVGGYHRCGVCEALRE